LSGSFKNAVRIFRERCPRVIGTLSQIDKNHQYPVIPGTGGLRKARIAIDNNKGKSGGARVCFVDFVLAETVYFITVYSKNEKDNLSKEERNNVKKLIDLLRKNLESD